MLYQRLKKLMDDIVDVAFADTTMSDAMRNRFKWYKLYILPKESKTSSGRYIVDTHTIEIYNARLGGQHMAKCCIHELAHHIDWCIHGKTGHKDPFFEVYAKLIYAALNMQILTKKDFEDDWSADHERVEEIIENYCRHDVDYQKEASAVIKVHNSYSIKNQLKERGYTWNNIEAVWETETEDEDAEEAFLGSIGAVFRGLEDAEPRTPWYSIEETGMVMSPTVYIEAKDWGIRTYDARSALKRQGFFFSGDKKKWLLKVKSEEFDEKIEELENDPELHGLEFVCQNRKIKKKPKKKE